MRFCGGGGCLVFCGVVCWGGGLKRGEALLSQRKRGDRLEPGLVQNFLRTETVQKKIRGIVNRRNNFRNSMAFFDQISRKFQKAGEANLPHTKVQGTNKSMHHVQLN